MTETFKFETLMRTLPGSGCLLLAAAVFLTPAQEVVAAQVGVAAAVNVEAFGTQPGGARRAKVLGDNVIYNERIETDGDGLVQVLLVDGSTFTVGANSDLVIDEFVYDPSTGTGKLVASFSKGVARFVGGKLSKKKGGVTVKTPVGTIGIRGGIANLDLTGQGAGAFSLLFGEELTFNGPNGQRQRIFEAGYTMQVARGLPQIRRTLQSDLNAVQAGFATRWGQHGGIGRPPGDRQVSGSGVPGANSRLGAVATAPRPKPRVIRSANLLKDGDDPDESHGDNSQAANLEQLQGNLTRNTANSRTGTKDATPASTSNLRILRAGATFSPAGMVGVTVSGPGDQGLAGGSSGIDQTVVFDKGTLLSGTSPALWTGTLNSNDIWVFESAPPSIAYFSQTVTDKDIVIEEYSSTSVPSTPTALPSVDGNAVANAQGVIVIGEDFGAFAYFPAVTTGTSPTFNYGGTDVIYGLYGKKTDFSSFGSGTDPVNLRKYKLYGDFLTSFRMGTSAGSYSALDPLQSDAVFINPLVAEKLGASFMEGVSSTGLLVLEDSPTTLDNSSLLAASFNISGSGAAQKSLVSLGTGSVGLVGGEPSINLARRGGHRWSADDFAAQYNGTAESMLGADGGYFFGTNAQNFVLSADLANDNVYSDTYVKLPDGLTTADTLSSTFHAGELDSETAVSSLSRSTQTYQGFAAAMVESTSYYNAGVAGSSVGFASEDGESLTLTLATSNNTVSAQLEVSDTLNQDSKVDTHKISYGTAASANANSTMVDNDTYAAVESDSLSGFTVTTDTASTVGHDTGIDPSGYFIPSTLVAGGDDELFAGKTKCTCAFLEWGYWGASVSYTDASVDPGGTRTDNMHLGTWVAGDITQLSSLPSTGTATYSGHAVGNVLNGSDRYLAAGNFGMSVDFVSKTATATVSDFDGKSFSSTMSASAMTGGGNLFSGAVTGSGITGNFNTSLVAGPSTNHDGAIGDFNVKSGSWAATGIVAGELQ